MQIRRRAIIWVILQVSQNEERTILMSTSPIAIATYPALVGAVLQARRKELGLSQTQIADEAGLNVSTWSRIENGESALTIEQLAAVAARLELAPSTILRSVEEKVAALRDRGIEVSIGRVDVADIVKAGSIPLLGASLLGALGPIGLGVSAAVSGYHLYAKLKKSKP